MSTPIPILRVRDAGEPGDFAYDRVWLFLDYGGGMWSNLEYRWAIGARGEDGLWLFAPVGRADTAEEALDLIPRELELARQALTEIRRSA